MSPPRTRGAPAKVVVLATWLLAGCSSDGLVSHEGTSGRRPGAGARIVVDGVELTDATFAVTAREPAGGEEALVEVGASGVLPDGSGSYQMSGHVTLQQFLGRDPIAMTVVEGRGEGAGKVHVDVGADETTPATGGTVTLEISPDGPALTGTVDVTPDAFDATLAGPFLMTCAVLEGGGGSGRSFDQGFTSPFCQQLATWAPDETVIP